VSHDQAHDHPQSQQHERQRERARHTQRSPAAHDVEADRNHGERDQPVQRIQALVLVVQVRGEAQDPERRPLTQDGEADGERHHEHRPAHQDDQNDHRERQRQAGRAQLVGTCVGEQHRAGSGNRRDEQFALRQRPQPHTPRDHCQRRPQARSRCAVLSAVIGASISPSSLDPVVP
jgi:hypothetical protein